jgi:hypothetical protein
MYYVLFMIGDVKENGRMGEWENGRMGEWENG